MLENILEELESSFNNLGTSVVWKRKIGDDTLWLSPIPFVGQIHINQVMSDESLGENLILEMKRVTLSYSVVGVNDYDLTQYREGSHFPSKGKDGKPVKVTLQKYIYEKMKNWGGQYVDDVFAVYADLNETLQKENLKEIKFDNVRSSQEELNDLEERVQKLRKELRLPPLIEAKISDYVDQTSEDEPTSDSEEKEEFDPFKVVDQKNTEEEKIEPKSSNLLDKFKKQGIEVHNPIHNEDEVEENLNVKPSPGLVIDPPINQSINPRFRKP